MTGCYNYRFLRQELARCRREGRQARLMFIDMDEFKEINDRYGHPAGDRVLQAVSETLRNNLRETDFVIRYGGDEFCVLLGNETRSEPGVAQRLQQAVAALRFREKGEEFGVSFSLGEAEDDGVGSPEEILSRADQKLYSEKMARKDGTATPEDTQ